MFQFGSTATAPASAPTASGFTFGAPPAAPTAAPTQTGFSFGAPTTTATTTQPAPAAPASTGFSFGAPTTQAVPAPSAAAQSVATASVTTAQPSHEPPIRLEQTLSTLTPAQQKKIAFLDEMIRGQGTYNEYLSNQLQALYSSYPLFFQSNDINPPVDTAHGKHAAQSKFSNGAPTPLHNGEDNGYISPKQLLQVLSSLYLSITTDFTSLKELDKELVVEEDNIDSAARQLSILLNDPAHLVNYQQNNVGPAGQAVGLNNNLVGGSSDPNHTNSRVVHLSQFQHSSELITVPSYYHWSKLASFEKRLGELQANISTVSESLSTLGILDTNSVDISTLILVLTETLQNQSMSLLSTAISVSNMSKKVKAYKEQAERVLRHRGADQYTLNLLHQHRNVRKDTAKIPLAKPTTVGPTTNQDSNNPSSQAFFQQEKTQLIPTGPLAGAGVTVASTAVGAQSITPAAPLITPGGFSGFGFGGATPAATAPAPTGFNFNTAANPQQPAVTAPQNTGFSFGNQPQQQTQQPQTPAPNTGFGFGNNAQAPTPTPQNNNGFSFGSPAGNQPQQPQQQQQQSQQKTSQPTVRRTGGSNRRR